MTSELMTYQTNLATTRGVLETTRDGLATSLEITEFAGKIVSILEDIDTDADKLERVAKGLDRAIDLIAKIPIAPIQNVAKLLQPLVESMKDRAVELRNATEPLESKFSAIEDKLDIMEVALQVQIAAVDGSIGEIDNIEHSLGDAVKALELMNTATYAEFIAEFSSPVTNAENSVAPINALFDDANSVIRAAQTAVEDAEAAIAEKLADVRAVAEPVVEVFEKVSSVVDSLDFLRAPLEAVSAVVKPIEWALDAVAFIFDTVVSPILDPILEALGINALMERIYDSVKDLLPDLLPAELEAELDKVFDAADTLIAPLEQKVTDFINSIDVDALDPVTNVIDGTSNLILAEDRAITQDNMLNGLAGDDFITGGKGDDTLQGGLGTDVLIGGEGDDTLDGGDGLDAAVLLGNFNEWRFITETNAAGTEVTSITAIHDDVASGNTFQGTDIITGVERVVFYDRIVDIDDFLNFQYVQTTAGGTLVGDQNGVTNDYLFGNTGNDTLQGIAGEDYLDGDDGADTLEGGAGDDWLDGGEGQDSFDGGAGNDTVSFLIDDRTHRVTLTSQTSRIPFVQTETGLVGIENLSGGNQMDWLWGDDGANRLSGEGGNDKLNGFDGNDILEGGAGQDQLVGGDGDDILRGGADLDILIGGRGNDRYEDASLHDGVQSSDIVWYGGGAILSTWENPYAPTSVADTGFAGLPSLVLDPGERAEMFSDHVNVDIAAGTVQKLNADGSTAGVDTLVNILGVVGTTGNDVMNGSERGEILAGGAGDDIINGLGAEAIDLLDGGEGDDILDPGKGGAFVLGGAGDDIVILDDDGAGTFVDPNTGEVSNRRTTTISLYGDDIDGTLDAGTNDTLDFSNSEREWVMIEPGVAEGHFTRREDVDQLGGGDYDDIEPIFHAGFETIIASRFNDSIIADGDIETVHGGLGRDSLMAVENEGTSVGDTLRGEEGGDLLIGGAGSDFLFGGDGADDLIGALAGFAAAGGHDVYDGGAGDDELLPVGGVGATYHLIGGNGIDEANLQYATYSDANPLGSAVTASLTDDVLGSGAAITFDGVENLRGTRMFDDDLEGNALANRIVGEGGHDTLRGLGGNDVLHGNDGDDSLDGGEGNDLFYGGLGENTLIGGAGIDTASWDARMSGDERSDIPTVPTFTPPLWTPEETLGTVKADLLSGRATFTYEDDGSLHTSSLSGIENLQGTWGDDELRGDAGDNTLTGGDDYFTNVDGVKTLVSFGNDELEGRGGDDVLSGGGGADVLYGDFAPGSALTADTLDLNPGAEIGQYAEISNFAMPTGPKTIEWLYRSEDTSPTGLAEYHFLSYAVGNALDNEILISGGGTNLYIRVNQSQVFTSNIPTSSLVDGSIHRMSFTLDDTANRVAFYVDGVLADTVDAALDATQSGGTLIFGQEQDDLGGGFNPSTITRGEIADIRIWDDVRTAEEIEATAFSEIANPAGDASLVANWRPDAASGTVPDAAGGAALTLVNYQSGPLPGFSNLNAGGGDDTLNGGAGADLMVGGLGNDTYYVDDLGDVVVENIGEGSTDVVYSSISLSVVENTERLLLTGTDNINATGLNGQNDILFGNAGDNWLDGLSGIDTMIGRLGNDRYFVDNAADEVRENAGEGFGDYIFSSVSFTTAENIERLYLTGSADLNATGIEAQNDILVGNTGANVLDGKSGADTMLGGLGNDRYIVDDAEDTVIETAGEGIGDYIYASVSYTTAAQAERLYLTGAEDIDATGLDGQNDVLIGNGGDNELNGKSGIDVLIGGAGNDFYVVDRAEDVVLEDAAEGTDFIYTAGAYQIAANVERLIAVEGETARFGLTARNGQSDILIGNSASNVFIDQSGRDIFVGGGGEDFFRFIANLDPVNNVNRINDFDSADDQIQLQQTIYSQIDVGILDASEFRIGTSAADADDRIIYDQANGVLYYDPDGTGAADQIEFVNVTAGTAITSDDFQIF